MESSVSRSFAALVALVVLSGCGGGGRYGYARTYVYLPDEEPLARQATTEAIYDEVRRLPDRFQNQTISWFGVVQEVGAANDRESRLVLEVRAHRERHLCEDESDESCRVTINDRNAGQFTLVVALRPEDRAGENRVQAGSLVRFYGTLVPNETDADGGPILRARYYRHWPRGQYVTTAAQGMLRQ